MYEFARSLGLIPPDPRGGRPGDPYVPPEPPPVVPDDPFNGEANAVLLALKTTWQKILVAHITAVGERLRRMRSLLATVLQQGAIYFPSGSLLKPAYDMLLSQMRSRIAAQVIADKRAREGVVEDEPPEPPPPPPPPPPPLQIYPERPVFPEDVSRPRINIPLLEAQARSKGAMTFASFKRSGFYKRTMTVWCQVPPCQLISAEEQYQAYVRDYVPPALPPRELPPELPPEPPTYWEPPEPGEPPIVAEPPPTLPGEVPVEPAEVVTAGFDFGALLRPPLIYVLGGLAAFMLLKK